MMQKKGEDKSSHHLTAIDANYEIIPRVDWDIQVLIAKHLEAKRGVRIWGAWRWTVGVES